jgi:hypothetical protein
MRAAFRIWATLLTLGVLVQIGAAGYGAFYAADKLDDKGSTLSHDSWDHAWNFHGILGTILAAGAIVLVLLGLAAKLGRPAIWWPVAVLGVMLLQIGFAALGQATATLGWLHPLNAVLIAALVGQLAGREWRLARTSAPAA